MSNDRQDTEQFESYHDRLDDHEVVLEAAREQLDRLGDSPSPVSETDTGRSLLSGGAGLAALGVAGVGTATAEGSGQVGTDERPAETLHTAALSLGDDEEIASLVGDGLTVKDGTLTVEGGD